jgi:hypothetical protein
MRYSPGALMFMGFMAVAFFTAIGYLAVLVMG